MSLRVPRGAGLVVTGPEGCGRTTLVRALVGLVAPAGGRVETLGGNPLDPEHRRRIGFGPEGLPFPRVMRVSEALGLVAALRGVPRSEVVPTLERCGIATAVGRRIHALEPEEVRRLSLACALIGDPEGIVLDDPWEFPETVAALARALDRGATVLVASPDPGGFPALLGRTLTLTDGRRS